MEIILKGNEIHKIFDEISFNGPGEGLFPKNIFILKFLQKYKVTYILDEDDLNEDWSGYVQIPETEEKYNKFEHTMLTKNFFVDSEFDILTIKNVSNTEEDFFYFKMKYC